MFQCEVHDLPHPDCPTCILFLSYFDGMTFVIPTIEHVDLDELWNDTLLYINTIPTK